MLMVSIKKLLENSLIFFNSMKGLFITAVSDSCDNYFCLTFQQIKCLCSCAFLLNHVCMVCIDTVSLLSKLLEMYCVSRVDKIGVFSFD